MHPTFALDFLHSYPLTLCADADWHTLTIMRVLLPQCQVTKVTPSHADVRK